MFSVKFKSSALRYRVAHDDELRDALSMLFGDDAPASNSLRLTFYFFCVSKRPRWIIEKRFSKPYHLDTWIPLSRRSKLLKLCIKSCYLVYAKIFGVPVSLNVDPASPYACITQHFDNVGIFLGTPGRNRKIVLRVSKAGQTGFIKLPISEYAVQLQKTELTALLALSQDPRIKGFLPKFDEFEGLLYTDDLQSSCKLGVLSNDKLIEIHNRLFALSSFSSECRVKGLVEHLLEVERNICSPSSVPAIQASREIILKSSEIFRNSGPLLFYFAHGDFTPWNSFIGGEQGAKIFDWELYGEKSKYFDLFHYIVSYEILVLRTNADILFAKLKDLIISDLADENGFEYLGLYFIQQLAFYVPVFEAQKTLHDQAGWQLQTWTKLLAQTCELIYEERLKDK